MPGILELSDEEFLNKGVPALMEEQVATQEDAGAQTTEEVTDPVVVEETQQVVENTNTGDGTPEGGNVTPSDTGDGTVPPPGSETTPPVKEEGTQANSNPDATGSSGTGEVAEGAGTTETPPDYKTEYEKIMAPFTANGRKVELKSPEEVKQLMQMGANYTRKMQELAPHRRVLAMLQNHKLTDESQLSFLIDLSKGDKAAIQKLLKDSGIDPRDIDVDAESTYQGGNHRVSDRQVDFQSTVDELQSMDRGKETIAEALKWDQASIDAVGNEPAVLRTIHEHRISGVYDVIANEVNRRRTLGVIPVSTPFLLAYREVGNELAQAEVAKSTVAQQPVKQAPAPVAKTVAQPAKQAVSDKAQAAAVTRSTPAKAAASPINPLAMSDDDFLRQMAGRV